MVAVMLVICPVSSSRAQETSHPTPPKSEAAVRPAAPTGSSAANIDSAVAVQLVRVTLIALDQANKTGNYSVLRDLGAPAFSLRNSAARLAEIFAPQRNGQLDMAKVAVLEPQFSNSPQILQNGMLQIAGFFPADRGQLQFELTMMPMDNQLRLFGLSVNYKPTEGTSSIPESAGTPGASRADGTNVPRSDEGPAAVKGSSQAPRLQPKPRTKPPERKPATDTIAPAPQR